MERHQSNRVYFANRYIPRVQHITGLDDMKKKVELIHTEEGTIDSDGDKYFPIHLTKDGKTSTFYCNYDAWQREQRWLNDLDYRREIEEKYKGQYESPIRPLEEFVHLKKDKEGYFVGMEDFKVEPPKSNMLKIAETERVGNVSTGLYILDPDIETVLSHRLIQFFRNGRISFD